MHASAILLTVLAAAAAAAPGCAAHPGKTHTAPAPASTSGSAGGDGSGSGSGSDTCSFLSCAEALGPLGISCVEFAFGGSGPECLHAILKDVETMPSACAQCVNALFSA